MVVNTMDNFLTDGEKFWNNGDIVLQEDDENSKNAVCEQWENRNDKDTFIRIRERQLKFLRHAMKKGDTYRTD